MKQLSLRLTIGLIICVGLGLLFFFLTTTFRGDTIPIFDKPMINAIQGLETPWLTRIMKFFTWIGSEYGVWPITVIAAVLFYYEFKLRRQAILLIIVVVGSAILNHFLKMHFKRERPEFHQLMDVGGYSFPSWHAMLAFSLYVMIAYIAWRNVKTGLGKFLLILLSAFMIIMIGTSRVYLGVHFPSDVIGGLLMSGILVTIAITIDGHYREQSGKK